MYGRNSKVRLQQTVPTISDAVIIAMQLIENTVPVPHHMLERFLGSGALGDVWLARGPGGVHKAVKFIALEGRHGIKELLAIQQIKQIHSAHLVQITDVWLLDQEDAVIPDEVIDQISTQLSAPKGTMIANLPVPQTLVVAMTLADINLFDRLEECQADGSSGIPYEELITYMQDAAKGIDFLNQPHEELNGRAIQHCDIKPQNLLLVGGSVQVCDFGLARVVGARKTANVLEGTLAYIAPEAARGEKPTPTTDQYSLAISYYELRTGKIPLDENSTVGSIIAAHISGDLDFSLVDAAEQKVLRKATSLKPDRRYSSNGEFVKALIDANTREEPQPWAWVKNAALMTAVFLLAAMAIFFMPRPGPPPPDLPAVELPAGFQSDEAAEFVEVGGSLYPSRISRRFEEHDVVFLLIHEPQEERLFYMMENMVWNGLFREYVNQAAEGVVGDTWLLGGKKAELEDIGTDDPRLPVLRVTVDEAYAFAQWLAGPKGHLPSVRQWDTATGLYRPDRSGAGPFVEPWEPDDIAVDRGADGPMPVGEAGNDISPFGIRDMAGNGCELTRNIYGGRDEVPLSNPTEFVAVMQRGRSYATTDGPLRFSDLEDRARDQPWPYTDASPNAGFRVVIEKLTVPSAEAAPE